MIICGQRIQLRFRLFHGETDVAATHHIYFTLLSYWRDLHRKSKNENSVSMIIFEND